MKTYIEAINISTTEKNPFHKMTMQVEAIVEESGIQNGIVSIYSQHTTLAIKITEDCRLMMEDCDSVLKYIAPDDIEYKHDNLSLRDVPETERINGKSHVKQLFMNTSETIPIYNGALVLGKWQDIFAVELDPARDRRILVTVIGE